MATTNKWIGTNLTQVVSAKDFTRSCSVAAVSIPFLANGIAAAQRSLWSTQTANSADTRPPSSFSGHSNRKTAHVAVRTNKRTWKGVMRGLFSTTRVRLHEPLAPRGGRACLNHFYVFMPFILSLLIFYSTCHRLMVTPLNLLAISARFNVTIVDWTIAKSIFVVGFFCDHSLKKFQTR